MRVALSLLAFFLVIRPAYADLDYKCLSTCTQQGKQATMCIPQCTYQDMPSSMPMITGMDYKCRASCLGTGYSFGYCQQACAPAQVVTPSASPSDGSDQSTPSGGSTQSTAPTGP